MLSAASAVAAPALLLGGAGADLFFFHFSGREDSDGKWAFYVTSSGIIFRYLSFFGGGLTFADKQLPSQGRAAVSSMGGLSTWSSSSQGQVITGDQHPRPF